MWTKTAVSVLYRICPRDDEHPVLLPVGEQANFRIKKDKLLLVVPELDGKECEYSVTSIEMLPAESGHTSERSVQ